MSVVLDTNALLWLLKDSDRLGTQAFQKIDEAFNSSRVLVSAASFWEVAVLVAKKRISLNIAVEQWRVDALRLGIEEVVLDGETAIAAVALPDLHQDPADRFIAAAAIRTRSVLVTSDAKLLAWKGPLACLDARV
jgi:PIN domain nuclease of toxin-antitoxin system